MENQNKVNTGNFICKCIRRTFNKIKNWGSIEWMNENIFLFAVFIVFLEEGINTTDIAPLLGFSCIKNHLMVYKFL